MERVEERTVYYAELRAIREREELSSVHAQLTHSRNLLVDRMRKFSSILRSISYHQLSSPRICEHLPSQHDMQSLQMHSRETQVQSGDCQKRDLQLVSLNQGSLSRAITSSSNSSGGNGFKNINTHVTNIHKDLNESLLFNRVCKDLSSRTTSPINSLLLGEFVAGLNAQLIEHVDMLSSSRAAIKLNLQALDNNRDIFSEVEKAKVVIAEQKVSDAVDIREEEDRYDLSVPSIGNIKTGRAKSSSSAVGELCNIGMEDKFSHGCSLKSDYLSWFYKDRERNEDKSQPDATIASHNPDCLIEPGRRSRNPKLLIEDESIRYSTGKISFTAFQQEDLIGATFIGPRREVKQLVQFKEEVSRDIIRCGAGKVVLRFGVTK